MKGGAVIDERSPLKLAMDFRNEVQEPLDCEGTAEPSESFGVEVPDLLSFGVDVPEALSLLLPFMVKLRVVCVVGGSR